MSEAFDNLRRALEGERQASLHTKLILTTQFKPGTAVSWQKGKCAARGQVVMNSYADRIKVQNWDTGKEYWIYASDIVSQP